MLETTTSNGGATLLDRRSDARHRVLKAGKIVFSHLGSVVDCTIRDVSDKGAKLFCQDQLAVPAQFGLLTTMDGHIRGAEVKWRDGEMLGVHFTSEPRRAPPRRW